MQTENKVIHNFPISEEKFNLLAKAYDNEASFFRDFPGACIAGGFVRDVICGKPVKDIDIFIPNEPVQTERFETAVLFYNFKKLNGVEYMSQNEVQRVWDIDPMNSHPTQVIELAPGLTLAERVQVHDFGFCQCWFDENGLHVTEAFIRDYQNKTYTLMYCEDMKQYIRSRKRAERLGNKYNDWTFVDLFKDQFGQYY